MFVCLFCFRCGPVGYDLDEEAVSKGKPAEIRLSKKEPECLKKFRVSQSVI